MSGQPFMNFLAENRLKFKNDFLEINPNLNSSELSASILVKARKIWRYMSDSERDLFKSNAPLPNNKPNKRQLRFDHKYGVWIDDISGLYYEDNNGLFLVGSVKMLKEGNV